MDIFKIWDIFNVLICGVYQSTTYIPTRTRNPTINATTTAATNIYGNNGIGIWTNIEDLYNTLHNVIDTIIIHFVNDMHIFICNLGYFE